MRYVYSVSYQELGNIISYIVNVRLALAAGWLSFAKRTGNNSLATTRLQHAVLRNSPAHRRDLTDISRADWTDAMMYEVWK